MTWIREGRDADMFGTSGLLDGIGQTLCSYEHNIVYRTKFCHNFLTHSWTFPKHLLTHPPSNLKRAKNMLVYILDSRCKMQSFSVHVLKLHMTRRSNSCIFVHCIVLDWIEQGLMSPPTQYRLSGRQFYGQKTKPTASKY